MAAHCWTGCSSTPFTKKSSYDIYIIALPPHLLCNGNHCKQSTFPFKLSAFQPVRIKSNSHPFLDCEMHSAFQSWQLVSSSRQPQWTNIHKAEMPGKRKKNCCCPESPLAPQATIASQNTFLIVFSPVNGDWLWETNRGWSHFSTIQHLRCAKKCLVTAVTLNQNISYLKK